MNDNEKKISEYNALHNELHMRINNLYNHNYAIVTLIAAIWAFIISAYIDCFKDAKLLCSFVAVIPICISFIVIFLMQQWNENFGGLGRISAYLMVFYEMPSLFSDELCRSVNQQNDAVFWETQATSSMFIDNKSTWYSNKSYLLVSIVSVILSFVLCAHSVYYNGLHKWNSIISICLIAVCFSVYIRLLIRVRFDIGEFKFKEIFKNIYIAVKRNFILPDTAKKYLDEYIFSDDDNALLKKESNKHKKQVQAKQKSINRIKSTDEYKGLIEYLDKEIVI